MIDQGEGVVLFWLLTLTATVAVVVRALVVAATYRAAGPLP